MARRFRNMARMAPDVLDAIVAALGNLLTGLGVAVKKISEQVKEETREYRRKNQRFLRFLH